MDNVDEVDVGYSTSSSAAGSSDTEDNLQDEDDEENVQFTEESYNELLQELNIFLPSLPEPNVNEMWENRMERNLELMSTISPSIAKRFAQIKQPHEVEEKSVEDLAAISIQKHFRGFQGRKIYLQKLLDHFEKEEESRRRKQQDQVEEGAILIENHALETEIEESIFAHKNRLKRRDYYVKLIQRAWRKYQDHLQRTAAPETDASCESPVQDQETSQSALFVQVRQTQLNSVAE